VDELTGVSRAADFAARDSHGRLLALLAASTSDLAAAEDALADAFERAVRTWPDRGVPANPDGWLLAVARNRLRDWWKSAEFRRTVALDPERDAPVHLDDTDPDAIPDRRL
jgi:predicted RNA polymerase sigma factor